MAGWIKMALGMELGLGPGDFVLDGDPAAPSPKRLAESPQFVLLLLVGLYSSSSSINNLNAPVLNPNGISIGLAVFAGLTTVTDLQATLLGLQQ